ncbi:FAER409Cp [Eremothecium gossypii FDAG1]|nr:FAER409Cp [Eremothecium gossypii FDAG1]
MEPFVITASECDCNSAHSSRVSKDGYALSDELSNETMFLTQVKYIFEGEEDHIDDNTMQEINTDIVNVVIVELDETLEIKNVELISDEYQLLGFSNDADNDLNLTILSEFPADVSPETRDLGKLVTRYQHQNKHLKHMLQEL